MGSLLALSWFPLAVPLLSLALLPAVVLAWLAGWRLRGRFSIQSGVEPPLVYVLLATCIATIPMVDTTLALPKLLGIAAGAAIVLAIGHNVRTESALERALVGTTALTAFLAIAGLFAAELGTGKFAILDQLLVHLPSPMRGFVPNTARGGVNPNELAGALCLFVPLLASWCLMRLRRDPRSLIGWFAGVSLVSAMIVMVASQSRGAVGGTMIALFILGAIEVAGLWQRPQTPLGVRLGAAVGLLALATVTLWLAIVLARVSLAAQSTGSEVDSVQGRLALWDIGLRMIADFPLTGIGLGQFSPVMHLLYSSGVFAHDQFVPHAHNLLIEYCVELGVFGASAFGALVWVCGSRALRALGSKSEVVRRSGLGLLLSFVAFGIFGLTDAIAPGARGGFPLWVVIGLCGAVGALRCA